MFFILFRFFLIDVKHSQLVAHTLANNEKSCTLRRIAGDLAIADFQFLSGRTKKSSGEPLIEYPPPPDFPGR
jgi:hypothetical protein